MPVAVPPKSKINIQAFPKQWEFILSEATYSAFIGGVGSGKTEGGVIKAMEYMNRHPNSLGMVTAPTYRMLSDSTLRTFFNVLPPGSFRYNKRDETLRYYNGSEILFRSTDDPDTLRGPNLAWFYMDEAAMSPHESFRILQGRLRQQGYPHKGWLTTTPKGFNWVYIEFAKEPRPDYWSAVVSSRDNPFLPPEFVKNLEESYPNDFALQEIEGQFIIVGGTSFFMVDRLKDFLNDCEEPRETRLGGAVKIWKPAVVAGKYIAGGDLAWRETGAYDCLTIWDWQTMEQVAEIHGRIPEDEMALESFKLMKEYNDAYVGLERNGEGINVVNKVEELGYKNRMFFKDWASSNPISPGWQTDSKTRPIMLGELEQAVRNLALRPRCSALVNEMLTFIRDEKGRPGSQSGAYDDHVMATAIAWQMRSFAKFHDPYVPGTQTLRMF